MALKSLKMGTALATVLAVSVIGLLVGCGDSGGSGSEFIPGLPKNVSGAPVSWGKPIGTSPSALVMLIPGGGWQRSPTGYAEQKASAKYFQQQGYATVAIEYDSGIKGFNQVVDTYKVARKHYPTLPICATGISAGGHFALMLAARQPDLTCVVTLAAPTDLTTLAEQDPSGDEAATFAADAFGQDGLAKWSPVKLAGKINAKVLLMEAASDPVVPADQGREFVKAKPDAQLLVVPPGPTPVEWAHYGGVQPDAQTQVVQREFDFIKQATQGG